MNGLALCAGYGGLELGIERVFPSVRTVCYVEGEAYAASHLVKKMEEGRLHNAPIWNDLRTFNGKPWRGKVDIIAGGFPCQPFSSAGKQLGDEDPRHLWPFIKRIIGEVRPGFLFFENVPGVIRWILPSILLDLAELGYNASWGVVAASEVGAPHRRKRWFLFAVRDSNGDRCIGCTTSKNGERINIKRKMERCGLENISEVDPDTINSRECVHKGTIRQEHRNNVGGICSNVSDSDNNGSFAPKESKINNKRSNNNKKREKPTIQSKGCGSTRYNEVMELGSNVSDSNGQRWDKVKLNIRGGKLDVKGVGYVSDSNGEGTKRCRRFNEETPEIEQTKRFIDKEDKWGGKFDSWWEIEPGMGRLVDGATDWVDKLRILGNGVVPQQAAQSLQILGGRLAWGIVAKREPKG